MLNVRRIIHPIYTQGSFNILDKANIFPINYTKPMLTCSVQQDSAIFNGFTYGWLSYTFTITFTFGELGKEKNVKIGLSGYGCNTTSLQPDHMYTFSGQLIALNIKATPVLHFEQDLQLCFGILNTLSLSPVW